MVSYQWSDTPKQSLTEMINNPDSKFDITPLPLIKTEKEYSFSIFHELHTSQNMTIDYLYQYIDCSCTLMQFKQLVGTCIERAYKDKNYCEHLCLDGNYDLLITHTRIHLFDPKITWALPELSTEMSNNDKR